MTKTAGTAAIVGVGIASLVGIVFGESTSPVWKTGEWIRLAITAIALIIGAYVIWKDRSRSTLEESIQAMKTAVDAHKMECEGLAKRLASVTEEKTALSTENIALRSKTDMGEVLRMLTVLTSNTFRMLEEQQEILTEIHKKVLGWKNDRREALRRDEQRDHR